ncbi:MAG: hypothetical protein J6T84_10825 [Spirochaetaceae bacterium]|nr:hypothetical protein [Spirochaetaceae bacterium]
MINVVIDKSGSMSTLGKPDVIQAIIRELQLTEGIDCNFYKWGEDIELFPLSNECINIEFGGKSSIQALLNFLRMNNNACLLLTDGFSNEDKSNFTAFLRDNSGSKLRIVLIGADSRVANGKAFFPENLIASEQNKFIFSSLDVSAAVESLNF